MHNGREGTEIMLQRIVAFIMLGICAYSDIRSRVINVLLVAGFGALSLVFHLVSGDMPPVSIVTALLPGAVLLLISRLTKGKLGEGDGVVIMALGLMTGGLDGVRILTAGLIFAAATGVILIIAGYRKYTNTMPLIPYIFGGYIYWLIQ